MKKKTNKEQGFLVMDMTTLLIFLVISSIVISLVVLVPLFSGDVRLGAKEWVCRFTLSVRQGLPSNIAGFWHPICSAERLQLTKKVMEKTRHEDETLKQGGMRYVLDLMNRCKVMVGGDQSGVLFAGKQCYICYAVDTDNDDKVFPLAGSDFYPYSLFTLTREGNSYLKELQSPGLADISHEIVLPQSTNKNHPYAIVYVDNTKPGNAALWTNMIGGCVLGSKVGSFIPKVGADTGCLVASSVVGAKTIYDIFTSENTNKLIFTELENLKERESGDILGCSGYVY